MNHANKKGYCATGLLLGMIAAYFGAICLINFSGAPSFYDTDMYADIYYGMKVWNDQSLFPENWVFGNQLYAFSAPVLAGLFYGLVGRPHIAMALSCTVMSLLLFWSFHWMLRPVMKNRDSRLLTILMFMSLSLFCGKAIVGNIGWSLYFTMCSYYSGYIIAAFLAFGCYLREDVLSSARGLALAALTCILSFCSGIQSIRQTVVMVAPLLMAEVLRILWKLSRRQWNNPGEKKKTLLVGLIAAFNFAGLIAVRLMEINQVEILGKIEFVPLSQLAGSVKSSIIMVCTLLLNDSAVSLPVMGLIFLICAVGALLILKDGRKNNAGFVLLILFAFSVLVIAAIDMLTTMLFASRYYFMLFPLMACLVGYCYESAGTVGKALLLMLSVGVVVLSSAMELGDPCIQALNAGQDSSYEVSDYLVENGYDIIYSEWDCWGQRVAMASEGEITASFWLDMDKPFVPVDYLSDPAVVAAEPDGSAYLFQGDKSLAFGVEAAEGRGVELKVVKYFPESDVYVCTASRNLMVLFDE